MEKNKILDKGSLGFAESYLDGNIETKNLKSLMLFFAKNETFFGSKKNPLLSKIHMKFG